MFYNSLKNAIGTYTKLCEIQPSKSNQKALKECQEVDTKLKLAIQQKNEGKLKEAAENLDILYQKYPYYTKLKQHLIEVYCETGDTQKTIKLINQYISEVGNTAEVWYYKGLQSLSAGNMQPIITKPFKTNFLSERAKNFFKKGMQFDPDDKKIRTAFKKVRAIERIRQDGNNLFKQQKYQEAYDKYTEGLNISKYNKNINAILYSNRA